MILSIVLSSLFWSYKPQYLWSARDWIANPCF